MSYISEALRYLAENDRPTGGQERFNAEHLYQLADEAKRLEAADMPALVAERDELRARVRELEKICDEKHDEINRLRFGAA